MRFRCQLSGQKTVDPGGESTLQRGIPLRLCWDSNDKAPVGGTGAAGGSRDAHSSPLLLIQGTELKKGPLLISCLSPCCQPACFSLQTPLNLRLSFSLQKLAHKIY